MRYAGTSFLVSFLVTTLAHSALAWDPLGHALAANVGAKLMNDRDWSNFLQSQSDLVGDAAGSPDTFFRPQSAALAGFEAEASTHYFHIDDPKVKVNLEQIRKMNCSEATSYISTNFAPSPPKSLPGAASEDLKRMRQSTVGSSPWRAEQFGNDAQSSACSGKYTDAAYYEGLGAHYIADHAVPWHAMVDAHGEASGHSNIHIFLEHCTDSFLRPSDPLYDPHFANAVEKAAKKRREQLLKKELFGKYPSVPSLAIAGAEESLPKASQIYSIDKPQEFLSGKSPAPGTKKDSEAAKRRPAACNDFKELLKDRLATGAAFVSIYYDRTVSKKCKPPKESQSASRQEIETYHKRDYPWLNCDTTESIGVRQEGYPGAESLSK